MNRLTTYFHSKNNLSLLEKSIKQNDDHHHPTKVGIYSSLFMYFVIKDLIELEIK